MDARRYIDEIIPANYFITKSMELTKVNTSGTLWFTKKFLVIYYYIFLSDSIKYSGYVDEICDIFDGYIDSLPPAVQGDARAFFYSSIDVANLKSPNFKLFTDFVGTISFEDKRNENQQLSLAKKYYFAFLMETGGQSKVKAAIRDALYKPEFVFTDLESIINDYYGSEPFDMGQVKNDYMASLRNERQILYYYGFFHSKSNGASDEEFSSLTPVGELALRSNFYEFLAIWEHQKIKMISQPVSVQLEGSYLKDKTFDVNYFNLNRHPYITILNWLDKADGFSIDEYKYLISRTKEPIYNGADISSLSRELEYAKNRVSGFARTRESKDEDFRKELLKYILGLRSDLPKDSGNNPLSVCHLSNKNIVIDNHSLLDTITTLYSKLSSYKEQKYGVLLDSCERELRRQYLCRENGDEYEVDAKIKIDWDLYNIHVDIPTMMTAMLVICMAVDKFSLKEKDLLADSMARLMPNIIKYCGYRSKSSRNKELSRLLAAFKNDDFSFYLMSDEAGYEPIIKQYKVTSNADLFSKLVTESQMESEYKDGKRERKTTLIGLLRAYNNNVFGTDGKLVCECCGNTTFITSSNETYLEYHHLIPFSSEGPDHYLNLYALCPLCHRKMHYIRLEDKSGLYDSLSNNNYLHKTISERLIELKKEKQLRSYHLDFLLADHAISNADYDIVAAS